MSDPASSNTSDKNNTNSPSDEGVDLIASILEEKNQDPKQTADETLPTVNTTTPTQPPLPESTPMPLAVLVRKDDAVTQTKSDTPKPVKKSRGVSVLIAGILVLLLSLPLVVSFMNQKKQTTDVRSKAAGTVDGGGGPYPTSEAGCRSLCQGNVTCIAACTHPNITISTIPSYDACRDSGMSLSGCDIYSTPTIGLTPSISSSISPYPPGYTECLANSTNPDRDCNWMLLGQTELKSYAQCILLYSEDTCGKLYGPKITPKDPNKKLIAWQPCSPTGSVQEAECMDGQTSTRYICQGDKGWQPDLTSICTKPYCAWPRDNPNAPCCPPKTGVDSCTPADHGGTDLYKCIPDPFISKCTWIEGCGGGYWKAEGWTDTADAKTNPVWADFEKKCGITITPPPKITPAPTLPPGSTGTPPPGGGTNPPGGDTPTPTLAGGQCTRIKIYKGNAEVTPSTLKAGDAVVLAVAGANASKGRIRVNGGSWNESSTLNAQNEYTIAFTIPAGTTNFSIEAEVLVNGAWK